MKKLEIGIKGHLEMKVNKNDMATSLGNEGVDVLSSPVMISYMEKTCRYSVKDYLENEETTVGIAFDIKHLASAGLDTLVKYDSELLEIYRKRLVFSVKCYTDEKIIGEGIHQRYIIKPKDIKK